MPGKPWLYLAAPLFTPTERELNTRLEAILRRTFRVFLPQRDGLLLPGKRLTAGSFKAKSRKVFSIDLEAIRRASVLLAVLDGRVIDEGVAFELGVAFSLGKKCIGYRSDSRVLLPWGINPMIQNSLSHCVANTDELIRWATNPARGS
jgi:nucleoside 2-deoxyribosyltransferase